MKQYVNKTDKSYPAKFLVFADAAPRALLFDHQQRFLGEVIEDDGFIVDSLLRQALPCPVPPPGMLNTAVPAPSADYPMRCFDLGPAPSVCSVGAAV